MDWGEIVVALLTGGVLTALIKGAFGLIKARMGRQDSFTKTIKNINKVYSSLDELKKTTQCDRVLIFTTKNGGGIPRAGAQLYASVLYETYDKALDSVRESWQDRLVDEAYIKLLAQLEVEQVVAVPTENMDEGILKNTYVASNIDGAILAKIKSTDMSYYYISCSFKNIKKMQSIEAKVEVLNTVAKIKDIL